MQKLAGDFMRDYIWIGVGRVGATTDSITQRFIEVQANNKMKPLVELLEEVAGPTLIFVAKKKTAAWLSRCTIAIHTKINRTHSSSCFLKIPCSKGT